MPDDPHSLLTSVLREQGRVLTAISEAVAVGADRQARAASLAERQAAIIARLDAHVTRQEAANAHARAQSELGHMEERAALTRLYDLVRSGLASSTGQRVIQTVALAWLAWAGVRYGFVLPASTGASVVQSPPGATHADPPAIDDRPPSLLP